MKNFALALAVAALAGGCAMYERSGDPATPGYTINCPSQELNYCFSKAGELCPKGYSVVKVNRVETPPPGLLNLPPLFLPQGQLVIRDSITVLCET